MHEWTTDANGDHLLVLDGQERARLPFIPPVYPMRTETEVGLKREVERVLGFIPQPMPERQKWWMMESTTLSGQLGMIVCWYWSNADFQMAARGVALIPELVRGETDNFTCEGWRIFAEALEAYADEMTPTLRKIFEIARDGMNGELPFGETKAFPEYPEH